MNGSYGCTNAEYIYYTSNTPKNKVMPWKSIFKGRYIDAMCINGEWFLLKYIAEEN